MAGPCQGRSFFVFFFLLIIFFLFFFLRKNLKLQRVMSRKTSEGEAEAVKEKRDRVGHTTADRPNSLPYYPRLWSSGTGVLSRDSLSQNGLSQKATESNFFLLHAARCHSSQKVPGRMPYSQHNMIRKLDGTEFKPTK